MNIVVKVAVTDLPGVLAVAAAWLRLRAQGRRHHRAVIAHVTTQVAKLAGLVASQHTEAMDKADQQHFTTRAELTRPRPRGKEAP